jgi:hypothetical protein
MLTLSRVISDVLMLIHAHPPVYRIFAGRTVGIHARCILAEDGAGASMKTSRPGKLSRASLSNDAANGRKCLCVE